MRAIVRYRSAITGRFVTREYAEAHPDTTVKHVRYVPAPILFDPGDD